MRYIAELLSSRVPDERGDKLAAQPGDWCQTPPDRAALERLAETLGAKRKLRDNT
jgi:predicted secreted protein